MLKCKINGQEVEVKEGTTIIEAFKQLDANIAHYCWHPGLSIAGVCRLCMVEIEGNPRLQIACNTVVQEGMVINNNSEKVKDTVKWGLDFHLINHPLDCPICDQAGECGLQDQYMEYGKYDPEMAERKVKKHKVVDLGPTIVLDSERCILCSRCVRFTEEVTKTNELGIFNRGDRSEIGTFKNKPLDNKYSLNTVDICPVGALTSKDFRFRQRVWYLKDGDSICTGCSTGCAIKVYYNEEGAWRVKPRFNPDVNGYWMCDEGRNVYKFANKEVRLLSGLIKKSGQTQEGAPVDVAISAGQHLKAAIAENKDQVALVVTGQYTVEETSDLIKLFAEEFGSKQIYHWKNNEDSFDSFDGLLLRGDRNPNTKGLLKILSSQAISTKWEDLKQKISSGAIKTVVVAGPENQMFYPDLDEKIGLFSKAENIIWMTAGKLSALDGVTTNIWQIPMKTFMEKSGTYINFEGREQKVKAVTTIVETALTLSEASQGLRGQAVEAHQEAPVMQSLKSNYFTQKRGNL
ncbi:MAG: (2Fe-2S)-binding protein [Bdellovibrionales bacterium]|nr:(2Fe-2S)-binding protein [Bdellovibrionales bacterium]